MSDTKQPTQQHNQFSAIGDNVAICKRMSQDFNRILQAGLAIPTGITRALENLRRDLDIYIEWANSRQSDLNSVLQGMPTGQTSGASRAQGSTEGYGESQTGQQTGQQSGGGSGNPQKAG